MVKYNKNVNCMYKDETWLYEQYIDQEKSSKEIAELCNLRSSTTIKNWLHKFNIPIRSPSERQKVKYRKGRIVWNKGLKGFLARENHYNWKNENAGQKAKHIWIKTNLEKPKQCQRCGKFKKIQLSFDHSKGDYTRNIEDYEWLCIDCHRERDLRELGVDWGFLKAEVY